LPGNIRARGYLIGDRTFLDPTGAERIHNGTVVVTPAGVRYVMTSNGGIPVSTLVVNGGAYNNPDTLRAVQERLNALGYLGADGNAIDLGPGLFGPNTLHAVNWFKDQNLPNGNRDELRGVVGQTTLAALFADSAPRANPNYRPGSTNPGNNGSNASGQIELIHVRDAAPLVQSPGTLIPIECARTGTTFNLAVYSSNPARHVDVVTASHRDHEIVRSLFGFNWTPRPVFATLGNGRISAGSMHTTPHSTGIMGDGITEGHLCLFFHGAGSDGDPTWIRDMNTAIDTAWTLANAQGRAAR